MCTSWELLAGMRSRVSLFISPRIPGYANRLSSKTGVTLKDSGIRDEHGMQPLEDLFSSPHKPTEDRDEDKGEDDEDGGASEDGRADSEDMDITTSTCSQHSHTDIQHAA